MRSIYQMTVRWDDAGVPIEARLEEALHRLEKMAEERLRLDRRIRQQRHALRDNWQIIEMRASHQRAWLRSPLLASMLKRPRRRSWWRGLFPF